MRLRGIKNVHGLLLKCAFLFFSYALFAPITATATHVMGGEVSYRYVGKDSFEISITVYRDCSPGNASMPTYIYTYVKAKTGTANTAKYVYRDSLRNLSSNNSSCITSSYCTQVGYFTDIFVLDSTSYADGFYIYTYPQCNRNDNITNLVRYQCAVFHAEAPPRAFINNSPQFLNSPIPYLCNGRLNVFNHGVSDLEGDSLVFSLVKPKRGGTPPNFTDVAYSNGYSVNYPFGTSSNAIEFDSTTGEIRATPGSNGLYVIAMEIKEYRVDPLTGNATYLGKTVRDLQFIVRNCVTTANNTTPVFLDTGATVKRVDVGDSLCFKVSVQDSVYNTYVSGYDTVYLNANSAILNPAFGRAPPYATFPGDTGIAYAESEFCWVPECNSITYSSPHVVVFTASDNYCYTTQKTYSIYVNTPKIYNRPPICVQVQTDSTVLLTWQVDTPHSAFNRTNIYRINPNQSAATLIASLDSAHFNTYLDTIPGTDTSSYKYFVRIVNSCDVEGLSSDTIPSRFPLQVNGTFPGVKIVSWPHFYDTSNYYYKIFADTGTGYYLLDTTTQTKYIFNECGFTGDVQVLAQHLTNFCTSISFAEHLHNVDTFPPPTPDFVYSTVEADSVIKLRFNLYPAIEKTLHVLQRRQNKGTWAVWDTLAHTDTLFYDSTVTANLYNYEYRIVHYDNCGNSDTSTQHRPVFLQVQLLDMQHYLWWTPYTGYASDTVEVQRWHNGSWRTISRQSYSDTTYTDTNLLCYHYYQYRVLTLNSSETVGSYSNITGATALDSTAPFAPGFQYATVQGQDTILVNFFASPSVDVNRYVVHYAEDGINFQSHDTISSTGSSAYNYWFTPAFVDSLQYTFFIEALDSCSGLSTPSDTHAVQLLTGSPGNLQNFLGWDNYTGFGYKEIVIYRSRAGGAYIILDTVPAAANSYNDTGLLCNVTYTYRLFVQDTLEANNYSFSNYIPLTPFDTIPPATPFVLSATVTSSSSINLYFKKIYNPDANRYVIFNNINGSSFSPLDTLFYPTTDTITYTHSSINTLQNTYGYYVAALDSCGENISLPSVAHTVVQLTGQEMNYANRLFWSRYSGFTVDNYEVQRLENGTWTTIATKNFTDTVHTDTLIPCNSTYYYRIKTSQNGGNEFSYSDTIGLVPFDTIPPAAPVLKFVTVQPNKNVVIEWGPSTSTDVNRYIVYRKTGSAAFTAIDTVFYDTVYVDNNVQPNLQSYCYAVSALDSCVSLGGDTSLTHCTINLVADSNLCDQRIYLSWNAYQNWGSVSKYRIWRSKEGGAFMLLDSVGGSQTAFEDSAASATTDYCYRIEAISGDGYSSFSGDSCSFIFWPNIPEVRRVSIVETSANNGDIIIDWENQQNRQYIAMHKLYYSNDGVNFTLLKDSIPVGQDSFIHTGINTKVGEHYYYLLNVDSCGNISDSAAIHKAIDFEFRIGHLKHDLFWTPYKGFVVDKYYVQELNSGSFTTVDSISGNDTTWISAPAPCNFEINYRIVAVSVTGEISFSDTVANQAIDTLAPDPVTITNATVLSGNVVQLDFTGNDSLDTYAFSILRSDNGGAFTQVKELYFGVPGQLWTTYDTTNTLSSRMCYTINTFDSCLNVSATDTFCVVQLAGQGQNLSDSIWWYAYKGYPIEKYVIWNHNDDLGVWTAIDTVPGTDTLYFHDRLPCNFMQHYKIEARELGGTRVNWSDSVALIPFDTLPPATPEIERVTVLALNTIEVSWRQSSGDVLDYEVSMKEGNGSWQVLDTVQQLSTKINVTNSLDSIYCFRVVAIDSCGPNRSGFSEHCGIQFSGTEKNLTNQMNWTAYSGFKKVHKYFIWNYVNGAWQVIDSVEENTLTYLHDSIPCNVPQHYKISALDSAEGFEGFSDSITLTPFDTLPPAAPRMKSASVQLDRNVLVSWETSTSADAKFYEVWRRDESGNTSLLNTIVYDSTYVDSTANASAETYQYYIIAIDSCNTANRSTPSDTDRTMMAVVTTGACVPLARLSWNSYIELPDTTDGYFIWRSDNGGAFVQVAQETGSFYVDSTILENNSYCYRIEAFDVQSGYNAFSDTVCMEPWIYPAPAVADMDVITVTATGTATGEVYIEWQQADVNDTFARGYYLYHAIQNGTYSRIHDEPDLNKTSFTHSGINTETDTHFYYVSTYNLCYVDADTNNPHIEGPGSDIHRNINLEVQNNNLQAELSWSTYKGFDISRYELYRRVDGDSWHLYGTFSSTDSTFTDDNLRCDINYSYKVVGYELNGFHKTESDTLTITAFDTIPPTAADMFYATVTATDPAAGSIDLEFTPATELNREGYIIYRRINSGSWMSIDTIKSSQTSTINYVDQDLNTKDNTYGYFVASYDSCGNVSLPVDTHIVVHLDVVPQSKANILIWSSYHGFVNFSYTIERRTSATSWVKLVGLNDTFWNDSTVMCDTLYTYRILTKNTDGNISYSNQDTATGLELEPPLEPKVHRATVTKTGTTNGEVTVVWNASPSNDADFYTLFRREAGTATWTEAATNISGLSITDQNLNTADKSYEYRLSVTDKCDNVSLDYSDIHRTIQLTATPGNQQIRLDWNHYGGWNVQQYEVYRDGILYETLPGTSTTYTDTLVLCINIYSYKVIAYADSSLAITSESNIDDAQNYDTKTPRPVYLKTASVSIPNDEVFIEWEETTDFDAKNYVLWRKIPGERNWQKVASLPIGTTSYTNPVQIGDEPVCYRVTVEDYCDNESIVSNLGCIIITTGTAPQYGFTEKKLHNIIYWTPYVQWVQGVNKYRIYRSDDGGFWRQIGEVAGTALNYTDSSLGEEDVKDFCYQVEAVEDGGSESESKSTVICLQQEPVVWIPNAFTPTTSAGINDGFEPKCFYTSSYSMKIYNRWGNLVFKTENSEAWNGKSLHGDFVPEGAYVYEIKVFSHAGEVWNFKGTVTVLR